jgi:Reverse transcriptase (RNA-dependent DNA polymerase).
MGSEEINLMCYGDDIALIADTEDDLQRLLYNFHLSCLKFNVKISIHKTKVMTKSKEPLRRKLEIDYRMVGQVMEFKYLGVNVTS